MELVPASRNATRGRLMATITHACTLDYVAKMLGEAPQLSLCPN